MLLSIAGQGILNTISFSILGITTEASVLTTLPVIPLYTILFAPVVEEVIFRYIIFGYIQKRSKKFSFIAAISSSILFAAGHMSLSLFFGYFFVGLVLCFYYYKTETLYTSILIHITLNFIVLFYQSAHLI
ncbi:CPBP family intramembrane glutamic endopeptidase [Paenibacillus sp. NAIST15-1]|uniref:CPBP family intramembrane glutamic endopeptidase n=1 Tax=Paenibacillus sp. NAIST15-1 TaxID=1605994 RepID=UPI001D0F9ECE